MPAPAPARLISKCKPPLTLAATSSSQSLSGAHVSVRFTIPGQIRAFSAESKVCWYDQAKARAGLHFLSLSPKHKSTLQDWLGKKLEKVLPQSVIGRFH
jgi:hypothetical protein